MTGPDSWTATGPRARPDPNPAAPETRIPHRTTEPPTEARFPTNGPSPASRGLGRSSNRVGTTRRGSEAIHATSRARWPLAISGPRANPPSLPGTGVEPAHPFGHMALNHARLPIPPPGQRPAGTRSLVAGGFWSTRSETTPGPTVFHTSAGRTDYRLSKR